MLKVCKTLSTCHRKILPVFLHLHVRIYLLLIHYNKSISQRGTLTFPKHVREFTYFRGLWKYNTMSMCWKKVSGIKTCYIQSRLLDASPSLFTFSLRKKIKETCYIYALSQISKRLLCKNTIRSTIREFIRSTHKNRVIKSQ